MAGLMNIGEMGALALHTLVELAVLRESDPESRIAVQEIARKLDASVHTLQKVVRRLIQMGLIEAVRGAHGGVRLAADPRKVNLLQIIQGVEGRICSNGCMFSKRVCPKKASCRFEQITGGLERNIREYLTSTTLASLAASASVAQ